MRSIIYFIETEEELIGKEIAFTQMARFADAITIVTKDKGFLVIEQWKGDYESQISIYNRANAEKHIFADDYLVGQLVEKNILTEEDVKNYKKKKQEQVKALAKQIKQEKEEAERRTYQRLKQKYGD